MKYAHILLAVAAEPWAIQPEKLMAILDFLAMKAEGGSLTAEEIQAKITNKQQAETARRQGKVAVLPLRGVIANRVDMMSEISGGTSNERFGRDFRTVLEDPDVKAIVMDVDSPGGTVAGTDELSQMIHAARGRKPIIAQVNATAASAAYWIATAADEVVVTPSGAVGSIGVFTAHKDVSALMEKLGVRETLISAGKYKVEGNPLEPLSEEARAHVQSRVDAAYDMFVRAVARNRGVSLSAVREGFGQGRMVDAAAAVAEGMADRTGTLEDTLQRFGASQYQPATSKRRAFSIGRERLALDL